MKHLFLFCIGLCTWLQAFAAPADSVQISLLTVMPRPNETYTIYGHTALRVHDLTQGTDIVYNWGAFDVKEPNFVGRFVQGKTDYFLREEPYNWFVYYYATEQVTVLEQLLAFSPEAKAGLLQVIAENNRPENRMYRYNFLFDNCTTRVRDFIEQFGASNLTYKEAPEGMRTFREQIYDCTKSYPWTAFGIDLLLGSGVDSIVSPRSLTFLPLRLKEAVNAPAQTIISYQLPVTGYQTSLSNDAPVIAGLTRNLLTNSAIIIGIAFLLMIVACFLPRWAMAPVYLVVALTGCLLVYMNFFSLHPCVSHNWNLLWLNPLYFIGLVGCFLKKSYPIIIWYHAFNFVLLLLFLLAWLFRLLPQTFEIRDLVFIIPLLWASGRQWLMINGKWLMIKKYG
ncbi:MAG: DUF4105 domain-containing protein [Candidatus Symbiothrix sp.]|nr:DUF4105 domain-containing protein [Candidatus Symbiothrix sp.]